MKPTLRLAALLLSPVLSPAAGAADLPGLSGPVGIAPWGPPVAIVPAVPGLAGIVVSRVEGPVAFARVKAERTDRPSPRLPPGEGVVTGPDGRFFIPLGAGLWTVDALAYGTWHRRPAVPVLGGTVTELVVRVP